MGKLKSLYENLNKKVFWICFTLSIGLIVTSFFVPPLAVIDASVLAAVGEVFAFATLATVIDAIDKGKKVSFSKGETQMTIDDEQEN